MQLQDGLQQAEMYLQKTCTCSPSCGQYTRITCNDSPQRDLDDDGYELLLYSKSKYEKINLFAYIYVCHYLVIICSIVLHVQYSDIYDK